MFCAFPGKVALCVASGFSSGCQARVDFVAHKWLRGLETCINNNGNQTTSPLIGDGCMFCRLPGNTKSLKFGSRKPCLPAAESKDVKKADSSSTSADTDTQSLHTFAK